MWLPLALLLYQRNAIMVFVVADADQNGFALTCDKYILFFVYRDTILCENGDGAIVRHIAYAHQRTRKVVERICARRPIGELLKWEATNVPCCAGTAVDYSDSFC